MSLVSILSPVLRSFQSVNIFVFQFKYAFCVQNGQAVFAPDIPTQPS